MLDFVGNDARAKKIWIYFRETMLPGKALCQFLRLIACRFKFISGRVARNRFYEGVFATFS